MWLSDRGQLLVWLLPGATLEKDGIMEQGYHLGEEIIDDAWSEGQKRVKAGARQPANLRDRGLPKCREHTLTSQR